MIILNSLNTQDQLDQQIIDLAQQLLPVPTLIRSELEKKKRLPLLAALNQAQAQQSVLTIVIQQLQTLQKTFCQNVQRVHESIAQPENLSVKVSLSILAKQLTLATTIQTLLQEKHNYAAYILWRDLYEMDVVTWGLFQPVCQGHNYPKTQTLLTRYYDYAKIEQAKNKELNLHIPDYRLLRFSPEDQQLYQKQQEIYHKYNVDDRQKNRFNPQKLISNYDWANPLFTEAELRQFPVPMQPNFVNLVLKSKNDFPLFISLYTDYLQSSSYIHSSFLSTQFQDYNRDEYQHLCHIVTFIVADFHKRLLDLPAKIAVACAPPGPLPQNLQKQVLAWQLKYHLYNHYYNNLLQ